MPAIWILDNPPSCTCRQVEAVPIAGSVGICFGRGPLGKNRKRGRFRGRPPSGVDPRSGPTSRTTRSLHFSRCQPLGPCHARCCILAARARSDCLRSGDQLGPSSGLLPDVKHRELLRNGEKWERIGATDQRRGSSVCKGQWLGVHRADVAKIPKSDLVCPTNRTPLRVVVFMAALSVRSNDLVVPFHGVWPSLASTSYTKRVDASRPAMNPQVMAGPSVPPAPG